jgi:branched-chain amino acid aminotransferase
VHDTIGLEHDEMPTKSAMLSRPSKNGATKSGMIKTGMIKNGAIKSASRTAVKPARTARTAQLKAKKAPKTAKKSLANLPSLALKSVWQGEKQIGETPLVWVNGKLLPKNKAMVSVYDHGLLYGDGIFEGIRVYKGKIFKCKQHMDRLYRCADKIHLSIPISPEEMVQVQRDCIEANGLVDGYIRLVVTRGYGTLGLDPRRCPVAGVICIADQIALYKPEFYDQGMRVIVAKRPKTPVACLDPRVKTLNYLNNILAKVEAIMAGCDEAIMLSPDGWVVECTGDNIFVIKNGKIFTPPALSGSPDHLVAGLPQGGLLEGVTRRFVKEELAPMCGYEVEEKMMRLDDVVSADEVFLTGTAAEIIAVPQIDTPDGVAHKISAGEGKITHQLRMKFRQIVTSDAIPED